MDAKVEQATLERRRNNLDGFWNRINNEQYHYVLKAKGEQSTLDKVKEFITRNYCRVKYTHRTGEGYYPLIEKETIRLYLKFFSQWYNKPFLK